MLNNMTLPKFKKCVIRQKKTVVNTDATPGRKKVWSEEIMINCDVICGTDEKMVWCAFPSSKHTEFSALVR